MISLERPPGSLGPPATGGRREDTSRICGQDCGQDSGGNAVLEPGGVGSNPGSASCLTGDPGQVPQGSYGSCKMGRPTASHRVRVRVRQGSRGVAPVGRPGPGEASVRPRHRTPALRLASPESCSLKPTHVTACVPGCLLLLPGFPRSQGHIPLVLFIRFHPLLPPQTANILEPSIF